MILQATIVTTLLLHATAPADPDATTARARLSNLLAAQRSAVLASAPAVPAAEEREADDPSISAVYPNRAFLERTLDITISGEDTEWTDAVAVDFGDGITVDSVRVASPTGLVVRITIDVDAALGARDVTVREGETEAVYAGAFTLEAPLAFQVLQGTRASGSVLTGRLVQHDMSTPFDAVENTLYIEEPGFTVDYFYAQQYGAEFSLLVDVPVPAGTYDLHVVSGPDNAQVRSTGRDILPIAARTPLPLKEGDNVGTLAEPYGTVLYTFTPPAEPSRVTFTVTVESETASPVLAVLPASGRFADLLGADVRVVVDTDAAEPLYVIYWDAGGAEKHNFTINAVAAPPPPPETEPNDECSAANRVASSSTTSAELRDANDVDWFVITAEEADVGKSVHVLTQPGQNGTDTVVDVLASDCTTSLGGPSPDFGVHEDFTSTPITAAGDIYVKVSASPDGYVEAKYDLVIALE